MIVEDQGGGFKTMDTKTYHRTAVIRFMNTLNTKTNLYKVPLSFEELMKLTVDEIKTLARAPRTVDDQLPRSEVDCNEQLRRLYEKKRWESLTYDSLRV